MFVSKLRYTIRSTFVDLKTPERKVAGSNPVWGTFSSPIPHSSAKLNPQLLTHKIGTVRHNPVHSPFK